MGVAQAELTGIDTGTLEGDPRELLEIATGPALLSLMRQAAHAPSRGRSCTTMSASSSATNPARSTSRPCAAVNRHARSTPRSADVLTLVLIGTALARSVFVVPSEAGTELRMLLGVIAGVAAPA